MKYCVRNQITGASTTGFSRLLFVALRIVIMALERSDGTPVEIDGTTTNTGTKSTKPGKMKNETVETNCHNWKSWRSNEQVRSRQRSVALARIPLAVASLNLRSEACERVGIEILFCFCLGIRRILSDTTEKETAN